MRISDWSSDVCSSDLKIVAFAAVIGVLTYVIIAILEPSSDGPSSERSAVFSDASGLKPRDGVRLAGVKVGYVTAIDLKGPHAVVHFQMTNDVAITSSTTAAVRYQKDRKSTRLNSSHTCASRLQSSA